MKVEIRGARKEDVDEIIKIGSKLEDALKASKSSKSHFHEKSEFIEFIKKSKGNILLVAEEHKQVIGFLYAKILTKDWCMIDNLAVKKNFQNMGVGNLLLNKLYSILNKRKITYIQGLIEINHKKSRKFWKDRGFKEGKIFVWVDKFLR